MIELLIATLATFGLSALISNYDGPYDVFNKLKSKYSVFRCTVCLSVWVAIPISILMYLGIVEYTAIIGAVIIIERLT